MPWHQEPKKDVTNDETLRREVSNQRPVDIRMGEPGTNRNVSHRKVRERRELKHLSTCRKRKKNRYPKQRRAKREEPKPMSMLIGVEGLSTKGKKKYSRIAWEGESKKVRTLYTKCLRSPRQHLSTTEHEEFRWNQRGPSRKAKHYLVTDSEPVP